jgi:hypothetical protein
MIKGVCFEGGRRMRNKKMFLTAVFCGMCVVLAAPVPADYSLAFSTGGGNAYSWTMTVSGGVATLSFSNNKIDACSPFPDPVLNDAINLPSMTLTNITSTPLPGFDIITAILVPNGSPLAIYADAASPPAAAGDLILAATVGNGGMLSIGTNFIAYSNVQDDLNVISYMSGYSNVLGGFVTAESLGYNLDLSFGGDTPSINLLHNLLHNLNNGSVSGTLSGQITAIPEPIISVMLLLGGAFMARRRRIR